MTTTTENKPQSRHVSSPVQPRALVQGLINLVLVIMTVRDIRQRSDDELNGSRKRWLLAAFAPPFGPIAYLIFGRKRTAQVVDIPLEAPFQA